MSSKTSDNNCHGITKLYYKWGHNSFLFTLACLAWFLWRVGTKPTRISYPCQRIALTQIAFFFSSTTIALPSICFQCIQRIRKRQYVKLLGILLLVVLVIGGPIFYKNYRENQLRIAGSGTIPASSVVASSLVNRMGSKADAQSNGFPTTIGMGDPVVSFNYDPSMSYGGTPPYDPEDNPAYNFVWQTVENLGLGSSSNPLDDLIDDGNTVLIKPNWVDFCTADYAVYTRPEVVRPLIDMAIAAGATTIYVGDGGADSAATNNVINNAGYSQMVSQLASSHPGITIQTVNLISLSYGWHWISLGDNSSFAGSNYTHYDLGAAGATLYNHQHYQTADPQGVNPNGQTLGWYAVNDRILDADVIINVPKMKTHQTMIATLSIKNLVGCTQGCTYNEQASDCQPRIPHHKTSGQDYYFGNDIFWRAILDMNKIILYSDQNGVLQPTQQRKYLTVIDGIQAMEKSQHHSYGGGGVRYDRHVVLASVDPVAADAVGCRIMGYDYSIIPSIVNADSDTVHPVGTNDPENIAIVGSEIDSTFNHVFQFNPAWAGGAGSLAITDFTPPTINAISRQDNTVTANISGGLVAYILYQVDGENNIEKMTKDGNFYSITVPGTVSEYQILAQDEHFNTANSASKPADYDWESYSDLDHTTVENSFSGTTNHVYMRGQGFDTTGTYKIAYYDGGTNHDGADGAQIQVDLYTNDADGILESECSFTSHDSSSYGSWHAVIYKTTGPMPYSYDLVSNSDPDYVIEDNFYVEQSAIPEFSTALGAIVALVLSACVYFWFRRKFAPVSS
jgi:uncharacterized protein (DUF362 family)